MVASQKTCGPDHICNEAIRMSDLVAVCVNCRIRHGCQWYWCKSRISVTEFGLPSSTVRLLSQATFADSHTNAWQDWSSMCCNNIYTTSHRMWCSSLRHAISWDDFRISEGGCNLKLTTQDMFLLLYTNKSCRKSYIFSQVFSDSTLYKAVSNVQCGPIVFR